MPHKIQDDYKYVDYQNWLANEQWPTVLLQSNMRFCTILVT